MAGAMRKMGIYLGLVEDDERRGELAEYEEYEEYAEAEVVPARRAALGGPAPGRLPRAGLPRVARRAG